MQSCSDVPAGTALFDSMFVFENYPFDAASPGQAGLRLREVQARDATNFPLSVRAYLSDRIGFDLAYDPRLFDRDTAQTMAGRLRMVLAELLADPDRPLAEAALDDRRGAAAGTGGVERFGGWRTGHARWWSCSRRRSARTPEATAVTYGEQSLTTRS